MAGYHAPPVRRIPRRTFFRTSSTTAIAAAAAATLAPSTATASAFDIGDGEWEGLSELYSIAKTELGPDRVKPVATLDWGALKADDGILFIHPTDTIDPTEGSEFMKLGGRLAVVDDFGKGDELLRRFKIQRVPMPGRPVAALRQNPELPIAEPWLEISRGQIGAPHPVVTNVKRLVLNHPMALVHPDLSPVLKVRLAGADDAIVAVAGQVDKGRLFAMSDPSAIINSMLRYPGNRAFAVGLVRYLANDGERVQGRLFIVTNSFRQEGTVGGDRTVLQDVESALRSLADSLSDVRKTGFPSWLLAIFAAAGMALLGIWVARTSGKPYKSPMPRYARSTPLVARGGVAGRFAMLAAPSSPKGLVLLELKSALFDAITDRFELGLSPTPDAVLGAVRGSNLVEPSLMTRLEHTVQQMLKTEAAMVAGAGARVRRELVQDAHEVVAEVVDACEALRPHRRGAGVGYGGAEILPPVQDEDPVNGASNVQNR